MKTTDFKGILTYILVGILCTNVALGQTSTGLSGTSSNTCSASGNGNYNTNLGCDAGLNNCSSCNYNTNIGYRAGHTNNTYNYNTMVGSRAGYYNNAQDNTFVGMDCGYNNTTGTLNAYFGELAGYTNQTGDGSTYVGQASGYYATGDYNTFLGTQSGYSTSTGEDNTFVGLQAAYRNTTGSANTVSGYNAGYNNATGSYNTITGWEAGKGVISNNYSYNTFYGYKSGTANTTGTYDVFLGAHTGLNNTASYNSFVGYNSGVGNTSGTHNTTLGYVAGYSNSTGISNTFLGSQSGYSTTSNFNTFVGLNAGYSNTTGDSNVTVGNYAGDTYANESRCTFVGYGADASANSYTNSGAFGFNATVTAANKVQIGNSNVTVVEAVLFNSTSDGRFKFNVQDDVKGLDFIRRLRPVSYQLNTGALDSFRMKNLPEGQDSISAQPANVDYGRSSAIVRTGFIAQEVEQAAIDADFVTDIVHAPADTNDNYSLAYGVIVVPLVKAVQEQQDMIDDLADENASLNQRVSDLEAIIGQCCPGSGNRMGSNSGHDKEGGSHETVLKTDLKSDASIVLYQNEPNPFDGHTAIRYFLPNNVGKAFIVFHNEFGAEINRVEITEKGFGRIEATTENLATGIFSYSLVVDDIVVDTKKMVKIK